MARLGVFLLGLMMVVVLGMGVKPAMDGLYGFMVDPPEGTIVWTSPTGFEDPEDDWTNETLAYDNNVTTYAFDDATKPYLNLTFNGTVDADRCRIYTVNGLGTNPKISIDFYYSGAWHNIWNGTTTITKNTWVEKENATGPQLVSKVRIRERQSAGLWLYEFDLGKSSTSLSLTENIVWRLMPYLVPIILIGLLIAYLTGKIGGRQRRDED